MRRRVEFFGVIALVAIYGGLLVKQHIEFERDYEIYCAGTTFTTEEKYDTMSVCFLEEYCLGRYKDITMADTAGLLKKIYDEREMITNVSMTMENCYEEIGVRMRIVELEREKTNAVLPPNMRYYVTWNSLQRFLDVTEEYYNKLYGKDQWNHILALDETTRELKRMVESVREEYKDAMEAYHGNDSNDLSPAPDDI